MKTHAPSAVPCHVIAGPLGVGKTTAVLDYLQSRAGVENVAVIVNDFGKAGLDGELLETSGSRLELRNIPGGCLCCSSLHNFKSALEGLRAARPDLTRIIIEPSGLVIMPDFVPYLKRLCEAYDLELRPIIALLNPRRIKEAHYKSLPFFGALVDHADVLVANRIDQCGEADRAHFREWTAALRPPKLRVVETQFGRLPEELFELERGAAPAPSAFYRPREHEEYSGGFTDHLAPVDEAAMRACVGGWAESGLAGAVFLRFKASLPTDQGQRLFEIADGTVYVRPLPASDTAKLDWITRGRLPEIAVREALARCRG